MGLNFKILLVEDMASFRGAVSQLLSVYNDVEEAEDLASARRLLQSRSYDVAILDKGLPDGDGISLISEIKELNPNCVVIILTSDSDFSSVKHCIARGADDYVVKSENVVPDLLVRIPIAVSRAASNRKLESVEQLVKTAFRYEIIGKSPPTMELRETVLSLKGSGAHVLITGESGTGKELIARRLNAIEDDKRRPFVAINCGAIPENLLESELFGHKKGAFTGAVNDRPGKFELAHNGDLFLDEIGELPPVAQVKLLRVIQEGECTRVGDERIIKANCRIIAATNRDLELMVKAGKFREDLYHRLNVVHIATTPLRLRIGDIPDLAKTFVLQIGGANFKITDRATNSLTDCDWPGNIRELRNAIERAIISARKRSSTTVDYDDVAPQRVIQDSPYRIRKLEAQLPATIKQLAPNSYQEFLDSAEREYLRSALEATGGDVEELAQRIGLGRSTLFKRLALLGIGPAETKAKARKSRRSSGRFILGEGEKLQ